MLGIDLSGVPVRRGEAASVAARSLRARAFTVGGEVHLPAHHGPLQAGPARGLLAHELTHVAQQRRLGPSLPAEDSTPGRALESEARAVEAATSELPPNPPAPPPIVADAGTPDAAHPTFAARATAPPIQRASAIEPAPLAPTATPDANVDELAGKLYDRIRSRLRAELLVDRERAGLVTDLR